MRQLTARQSIAVLFSDVCVALVILVLCQKSTAVDAQKDCPASCDQVECLSGLEAGSCPEGTFYQEDAVSCNCCPACVEFQSLNGKCDSKEKPGQRFASVEERAETSNVVKSPKCSPGLKCTDKECQIHPGDCFAYQYQDVNILKHYCEPDGTYSAVQCKGDPINGRCFCYNSDGSRLFGSSWWKNAKNMTCACSREAALIKETLGRTDVSLHCSLDGNYEQLQCDDHLCWCADFKTGVPIVEVVPDTMMTLLPCYVPEPDKTIYLRECESIEISVNHIRDIAERHGNRLTITPARCDQDGSYGPVQLIQGEVRCARQDRTMIGNWQGNLHDIKNVDCNCARDKEMFAEYGLDFYMECQTNGNYLQLQSDGGANTFCVDRDGFPTTIVGTIASEDCPKW
ncbi:uncharacterized protein LOC124169172 [Ischnura elegans]|uniref:uncharacterized protein LOC124169172 n=1 Tax=Ischnura elegans TaxID=197161 RepID=UPI001ED8A979|nr:uncharacterized protein LOC124169172 [Ischnura elegans]